VCSKDKGIKMIHDLKALEGVSMPVMSDFWSWVKNAFTPSYQNEVEMYLKDSVDHSDLEQRMKSLMRRGML
jgi:hypothetical protein